MAKLIPVSIGTGSTNSFWIWESVVVSTNWFSVEVNALTSKVEVVASTGAEAV